MGLSVAKAKKQKHDWVRALVMPKKAKKAFTKMCKRKPASSACEGQKEPKQPCTADKKEEKSEEEEEAGGNTSLNEESSDDPPAAGLFDICF